MDPLLRALTIALPVGVVLVLFLIFGRKDTKVLMDEQAEIQRDIARHLDRIATALEKRKP
ncbi:MAG: hypothetical protein MUE52_10515 [Tabrizicola sp.]|jgi:hypothetical protein|nr:hypothetical protein [Tabrizicola sp.]